MSSYVHCLYWPHQTPTSTFSLVEWQSCAELWPIIYPPCLLQEHECWCWVSLTLGPTLLPMLPCGWHGSPEKTELVKAHWSLKLMAATCWFTKGIAALKRCSTNPSCPPHWLYSGNWVRKHHWWISSTSLLWAERGDWQLWAVEREGGTGLGFQRHA